jgi:hypothetical protein
MIICFAPNGNVTYEECPECGEPDVKVEHGHYVGTEQGKESVKIGPMHYWHCPICGEDLVFVCHDCALCSAE